MRSIQFELDGLRRILTSRGIDSDTVEAIISKAEQEIIIALQDQMDSAIDQAVQIGVQKDSLEFINDLRPRPDAFVLDTASGSMDFSDPPYPMLDKLLTHNAKPMADGSGVYKIIPVGSPSKKSKPAIYTNIFDAQKALSAERYEKAVAQYDRVAPKSEATKSFRTATSKQSRNTQWVLPAKDKDFTGDMSQINNALTQSHDQIIADIIRNYSEAF